MKIGYKHNLSLAKNFFDYYYPLKYLATGSIRKFYLGNENNRKCRFCSKTNPDVTFVNEAHTISKLLGNINSLSYFECDTCNELFSKYEKDLSKYLGPLRTIAPYMGANRRNPRFEHKEGDLKVYREGTNITVEQHQGKSYLIDDEKNKILKLKYNIENYTPLNVYKSLVKMAMCLLDDNEFKIFNNIGDFLLSSSFDNDIRTKANAIISTYVTPDFYFEYPTAYLLKRKQEHNLYPVAEFVFVIYFYQFFCQISLPFSINDEWIFNKEDESYLETRCYPALMIEPNGEIKYELFDNCIKLNPFDLSETGIKSHEDEIEISYGGKMKVNPNINK
jgi:hypothetical protein